MEASFIQLLIIKELNTLISVYRPKNRGRIELNLNLFFLTVDKVILAGHFNAKHYTSYQQQKQRSEPNVAQPLQ
jgi:hypothetical protein